MTTEEIDRNDYTNFAIDDPLGTIEDSKETRGLESGIEETKNQPYNNKGYFEYEFTGLAKELLGFIKNCKETLGVEPDISQFEFVCNKEIYYLTFLSKEKVNFRLSITGERIPLDERVKAKMQSDFNFSRISENLTYYLERFFENNQSFKGFYFDVNARDRWELDDLYINDTLRDPLVFASIPSKEFNNTNNSAQEKPQQSKVQSAANLSQLYHPFHPFYRPQAKPSCSAKTPETLVEEKNYNSFGHKY